MTNERQAAGWRRQRRGRWLMRASLTCFLIIVLLSLAFGLSEAFTDPDRSVGGILASIAAMVAAFCIAVLFACANVLGLFIERRGRRESALTADQAMTTDRRPPVLYFRSFAHEPSTSRFRAGNMWSFDVGEEQHVHDTVIKAAPMVAIGRPGDTLPQLGANRLYVADSEWRTAVLALLQRACGVIVRVGPGSGLAWEVQQIAATIAPDRILFIIPRNEHAYGLFKAEADRFLPRALPRYPGDRNASRFRRLAEMGWHSQILGFLWFLPDWSPRFEYFMLPRGDPSSKVIADEFARCLQPFLARIGRPHPVPLVAPGVVWRFRAPPNWPPAPDGWTPPPHWLPNAAWPAPPKGWQFWSGG